jgi:hypothetical protein
LTIGRRAAITSSTTLPAAMSCTSIGCSGSERI